jgi:signal peptidase I
MDDHISQSTGSPHTPVLPGSASRRWSRAAGGVVRDTFGTIVPALIIALLIHLFLAQATRVYGQSMEPNLHEDQRLVIEKVSYRLHGPRRGDVVILHDPAGSSELLIKRVVALAGEQVTVGQGRVYIDGDALGEPYLTQETMGPERTWTVPPLSVFVMGDNRVASRDSRTFGAVRIGDVVGHAVFRYWPLNRFGPVE